MTNLAYKQYRLSKLLKRLDSVKKEIRSEFFTQADQDTPDHVLPKTVVRVPKKFFDAAQMDYLKFLYTRYPSWDLLETKEEEDAVLFLLRKNQSYFPYSLQADGYEISRSVSEMTPEVDWATMRQESEDLFQKLAKPVTKYELDVEKFQELMKDPTFDAQGFLARHTIHKAPVLKVLARELKEDE